MTTQFRRLHDGSIEVRGTDGSMRRLIIRPSKLTHMQRLNAIVHDLGELVRPLREATYAPGAEPFEGIWRQLESTIRELEPALRNLDDVVDAVRGSR